ncbi:MAG: hypothetical protein IT290_05200 [Deltaproteobacteria bacterium]|nr:hypothetical protein [Deltaproteobacteria bacterium]
MRLALYLGLALAAVPQLIPAVASADDAQVLQTTEKADSNDDSDQQPWGLSTGVGFYTDYMFRGKAVYPGTSIQPSVTGFYDLGEAGTIVANVWMHVAGETNEPPEKFTELDSTISYDKSFDMVTLSLGHIFYTFPGGGGRIAETNEYFVGLSLDMFSNPTFTFYNDYDIGRYQYYTLTFREPLDCNCIGDDVMITPYVTFGFATNADDQPQFYVDNGLEHIDIGVSTDLEMGQIIVTPNLNFTVEVDEGAENQFWLGVDFSYDI